MELLFQKISSYNILNNLIPGAVFVFFWDLMDIGELPLTGIIESIFIYYFCGLVVSRVGSLVVESVFKKLGWIKFASKKDYIVATRNDSLIETLLETSNLYRTCVGLFLTLCITKAYTLVSGALRVPKCITIFIVVIVLLIVFSVSFIKQTKHILSRVDAAQKTTPEV